MNSKGLASSQFADLCSIPRPTVSQILNGRNKKISDELIGKIHTAFPNLSVLWLMFGEGGMTTDTNIEISDHQKAPISPFDDMQQPEQKPFSCDKIDFQDVEKNMTEKSIGQNQDNFPISDAESTNANEQPDHPLPDSSQKPEQANAITKLINASAHHQKRITSIVVFYEDSTFQTFSPS